ncbi:hypothetical protein cyc_02276 [Cyclospora cayetanensis]|uniref:Transmembrane protein n=1 Tax=Cyclospora cayetanensis TaxID=88456 RepID=A0A1D3D4M4_9EIME|nr:hypothetical protein cyc_02276 [Cyclospora cayetanensis]
MPTETRGPAISAARATASPAAVRAEATHADSAGSRHPATPVHRIAAATLGLASSGSPHESLPGESVARAAKATEAAASRLWSLMALIFAISLLCVPLRWTLPAIEDAAARTSAVSATGAAEPAIMPSLQQPQPSRNHLQEDTQALLPLAVPAVLSHPSLSSVTDYLETLSREPIAEYYLLQAMPTEEQQEQDSRGFVGLMERLLQGPLQLLLYLACIAIDGVFSCIVGFLWLLLRCIDGAVLQRCRDMLLLVQQLPMLMRFVTSNQVLCCCICLRATLLWVYIQLNSRAAATGDALVHGLLVAVGAAAVSTLFNCLTPLSHVAQESSLALAAAAGYAHALQQAHAYNVFCCCFVPCLLAAIYALQRETPRQQLQSASAASAAMNSKTLQQASRRPPFSFEGAASYLQQEAFGSGSFAKNANSLDDEAASSRTFDTVEAESPTAAMKVDPKVLRKQLQQLQQELQNLKQELTEERQNCAAASHLVTEERQRLRRLLHVTESDSRFSAQQQQRIDLLQQQVETRSEDLRQLQRLCTDLTARLQSIAEEAPEKSEAADVVGRAHSGILEVLQRENEELLKERRHLEERILELKDELEDMSVYKASLYRSVDSNSNPMRALYSTAGVATAAPQRGFQDIRILRRTASKASPPERALGGSFSSGCWREAPSWRGRLPPSCGGPHGGSLGSGKGGREGMQGDDATETVAALIGVVVTSSQELQWYVCQCLFLWCGLLRLSPALPERDFEVSTTAAARAPKASIQRRRLSTYPDQLAVPQPLEAQHGGRSPRRGLLYSRHALFCVGIAQTCTMALSAPSEGPPEN